MVSYNKLPAEVKSSIDVLMEYHGYSYVQAYEIAAKDVEKTYGETSMGRKKRNKKHKKQKETVVDKLSKFKIYVVGLAKDYANWLPLERVERMEDADLVMFTGGADVNPELYGEEEGMYTTTNYERDFKEVEAYKKAIELDKHIIGICRGAQLACVLSGGQLIQHAEGHSHGDHDMVCTWKSAGNFEIEITSSHHQMMYPFNMEKSKYRILAYSKEKLSSVYLNGDNQQIAVQKDFCEPEIIVFKNTKTLAIQGHPEWMGIGSKTIKDLRELVHTFLLIKKFKDEQ